MGVVSQTNTLDRSLTVWENLYFHGRYFGMGKKESKRVADADARGLPARRPRRRRRGHALRRHGAAADGRAQHRPPSAHAVPGRADVRPGPAIADRAVGDHRADPRRGADVVLTTHYMEEADRLCERVAIMDHGKLLALDTPDGLKRSVGGDSVVKIKAGTEPDSLAAHLPRPRRHHGHHRRRRDRAAHREGVGRAAPPHHRHRRGGRVPRCTTSRSTSPRSRRSSSTSPGRT